MSYVSAQRDQLSHAQQWSDIAIEKAITNWKLTEKEQRQLMSFKIKLSDDEVDHFKNTPHELGKYIRGPKGPDHAEEIFRSVIRWRKNSDEDIDNMLDDYKMPRTLWEYAPSGLLEGVDREGDPIYLERAGDMDAYSLSQRYNRDELLKSVVWRREMTASGAWIDDYEKRHGHLPRQLNVVYDLKGLNSRHMNNGVLSFFKEAVAYTQDKYYGVSKRVIIIRPPSIFRIVWRIAQHFFQPEVRAKIIFADKDYLKTLDKYMDRSVLPPCVNPEGSGSAARGFPPSFVGGLIPTHFSDGYDENPADACSTGENTLQTYQLRQLSGSFLSNDGNSSTAVVSSLPPRINVSVMSRSLLRGTLLFSECEFKLKIDSPQYAGDLQESYCREFGTFTKASF